MLFLIISIICSVSVGVLLKLLRPYRVRLSQLIGWNYAFAAFLCYVFFEPEKPFAAEAPWSLYLALAVLLPLVFLFLAVSIRHMGIVRTDAAQRMALCIPLLASWLLFQEQFTTQKIIALVVGLPAMLLIISKPSENAGKKWVYPVVVLVGFGTIDILFKQLAGSTQVPFTRSLFVIFLLAFLVMVLVVAYEIGVKKRRLQGRNLVFGLLLGALNFGNIYCYLRAHQAFVASPSTVFAVMNIGVIVLGSLVGVLAFREQLSTLNYVGLCVAVAAILLIALPYLGN